MRTSPFLLFFGFVYPAFAQSEGMKCTYTNLNTNQTLSGDCTTGPAGVAITTGSGMISRIYLTVKDRQGEWATVEFNGLPGTRYEIDRCKFSYATRNLKEFLETSEPCDGKPKAQNADRPNFMTAGGAWVGRWYTGAAKICMSKIGEVEGLSEYTTKKLSGYESECDVERITPVGAGVEVVSKCWSEGEQSREKEYLEVVDGKLKRSVMVGRKRMTFTSSRCPS